VLEPSDAVRAVLGRRAGDRVRIQLVRGRRKLTLTLRLGRPAG